MYVCQLCLLPLHNHCVFSLSNTQVGVINFSKSFTDYGNPIRAHVSTNIVSITAPYDITLNDRMVQIKVVRILLYTVVFLHYKAIVIRFAL